MDHWETNALVQSRADTQPLGLPQPHPNWAQQSTEVTRFRGSTTPAPPGGLILLVHLRLSLQVGEDLVIEGDSLLPE